LTFPPVQLQGGGGTYTFATVLQLCTGTVDGAPDVFEIRTDSAGNYTNILCLPGWWGAAQLDSSTANAVIVTSLANNAGKTFSFPYHIEIAGSVGEMRSLSPASGSGTLHVIPTGLGDPPVCTTTFAMEGEFSISTP
jgi:hypothetical protein